MKIKSLKMSFELILLQVFYEKKDKYFATTRDVMNQSENLCNSVIVAQFLL